MYIDDEKRYVETLRNSLRIGIEKVPPAAKDWSYNQAVAFKECIRACKKTLSKKRVSSHELTSAINRLGTFWGQG